MAKVCKGGNLVPAGQTQWAIPYTASHEGETACINSGGAVVEEGGGCGSTSSAQNRSAAPDPGVEALVEGAFAPARRLRESLAGSAFIDDLDVINNAPDVPRIIAEDSSIIERLSQVVGMVSGFAVDLLVPAHDEPIGVTYSAELHEWFTLLANDLQYQLEDDEVNAAIDRVISRMGAYEGSSVGAIYRSLRTDATNASPSRDD